MRGVPTRPADVGRRQFRPRIGLVRARKRCCARRRRRKKSRGGRRRRGPQPVCVPFDHDLPRADKITRLRFERESFVLARGILLWFRFVSLRRPFDNARRVVGVISCCDPRSFEGDPGSGGAFGVSLRREGRGGDFSR